MRVALVTGLRLRAGDLMEFMLLRAIHAVAAGYVKAETVMIAGELPENGFPEISWSLEYRKITLPVIWLDRPEGQELNGEAPGTLLKRIREAGELPEFSRPPYEIAVADCRADGSIRLERHAMVLPAIPGMTDYHVHTELAYCEENMNIPRALEMARLSNMERVAFVEHTGQLYFGEDDYWAGRCVWGTRGTGEGCSMQPRMHALQELFSREAGAGDFLTGFELDVDRNGEIVLEERDREKAELRLGAVHHISDRYDINVAKRQFLLMTEALLSYGIHVLAHPFRIFPWAGWEKPKELYEPVAELLKRYHTAAEINFHSNIPEMEFFDLCVKKGVKLAFGSDSHNLYEVGFFLPHMNLVRELGVADRLDEVLYRFTPEQR